MNIFFVNKDPAKAARALCDKHVVKMTVESAQMMATAHRVLDGRLVDSVRWSNGPNGARIAKNRKVWIHPSLEHQIPKATHVNHPSNVWVRQSTKNYMWLFWHFNELLYEYEKRYERIHAYTMLANLFAQPPENCPVGKMTPIPCAMDEKFIISDDPVENYRNYYRLGKVHILKYKCTRPPRWLQTK